MAKATTALSSSIYWGLSNKAFRTCLRSLALLLSPTAEGSGMRFSNIRSHTIGRSPSTRCVVSTVALLVLFPSLSAAQLGSGAPPTPPALPSVFLDCQGNLPCDRDHFRTEIRFVNWALDRVDADVHVIATQEDVGGGGSRIVLDFIGRGEMVELTDRLTYTTRGSDVAAETIDGLTQSLGLGLMRYGVERGLGSWFALGFDLPAGAGDPDAALPTVVAQPPDPWNHWTFRVGLSGDLDLRETDTSIELSPRFSAERITEDWKIGFDLDVDLERNRRELSGGRVVRDDRDEWEIDALVVRSVSDHISVGFTFDSERSVADNQNIRLEFAPAIEYNYFPYSMSNRRQLRVQYAGGVQYSDYGEETIFGVMDEMRPVHQLSVRYNAREAWGNAGVGVDYFQYLHDMSLYRARINGDLNLRITRGLDLVLGGSWSWVQDEIHIPLSDASDEDILLGRQSLPSSYRYTARVGLGFRFGSVFTNIVNSRFTG